MNRAKPFSVLTSLADPSCSLPSRQGIHSPHLQLGRTISMPLRTPNSVVLPGASQRWAIQNFKKWTALIQISRIGWWSMLGASGLRSTASPNFINKIKMSKGTPSRRVNKRSTKLTAHSSSTSHRPQYSHSRRKSRCFHLRIPTNLEVTYPKVLGWIASITTKIRD